MNSTTIKKYRNKSVPKLIKKATEVFNRFIRERDAEKPCVSCGGYKTLQAGHFYSAGHYSVLRFEEDNCSGQCVRCNMYLSGNLLEYRKGLIDRIGIERVERLDFIAAESTRRGFKWDRFSLIEIIEKYK